MNYKSTESRKSKVIPANQDTSFASLKDTKKKLAEKSTDSQSDSSSKSNMKIGKEIHDSASQAQKNVPITESNLRNNLKF
ncbi:MAG: hypothetical protein WA160_12075 [Pseudobdellovibrio sp.]